MKIILILVCLLLSALIYYQVKYYPHIEESVDSIVDPVQSSNSTQNAQDKLKALQAYAEIVQRPLFAIDRKPPAEQNEAVDESVDIGELENLVLLGVVISGDTKYAIVGNRQEKSTEQVKEGHRYKGWRVSAIVPNSIKFVGRDAEYELFISPNETNKKSGLRDTSKKPAAYQPIFRSMRKN